MVKQWDGAETDWYDSVRPFTTTYHYFGERLVQRNGVAAESTGAPALNA